MFIITSLLTIVIIITSVAVWLFLSSWMPTKGKALLISEVERRTPVTLSIGSLRYRFFQGLILERMRVVDRATHAVWATVPAMHIRVDWLGLLLRTHVGFAGRATLEAPCETTVAFSGRSDPRHHTLALDIRTEDISIRSFSAPLTTYLPPGITDGTVRLNAHLAQPADAALTITGRAIATHLVWTGPTSHVKADVVIDGTAWPPHAPKAPWAYDAKVTLRNGSVDGIPGVGFFTDIRGSAHATTQQLEIHELIGRMLDVPWHTEGFLMMGPTPALEFHWTSSMPLAPLAAAMAPLVAPWQLEGGADVAAVCRGPFMPSLMLDCLLRADLRRVALDGLLLAHPVTDLTGRLTYDLLAHRVSLDHVSGQLADHPLTVDGTVALTSPMQFGLAIEGLLPLEFVRPWLPASTPLTRLGGIAAVTLHLKGTSNAPIYDGTVELREAALQWTQPAITVEHLGGMIRLTRERLAVPHATCQVNGQPLTVTGMLFPLEGPRVNGTITFPRGTLALAAHATPKQLIIDDGTLTLTKSRLAIRAALDRAPEASGTVEFSGGLELAELSSVPFLSLPQLEAWQPQGLIEMNGRFAGSLAHWTAATIHARAQSEALRLRNIPVQDLRGSFDQERGSLRIAIPSALVAGGRFQSTITVDHRAPGSPFRAEADLLGLQLAQLQESIPQWKARNVTGIASSHATASGVWGDRSTWIGEGWLDASGERLGEIPLLERLFQRGLLGPLAEWLRWDPLRRAEITKASLHWKLLKERVQTEDVRLAGAVRNIPIAGNAAVALYVHGSVGLDQTVDLTVEPELSEQIISQSQELSSVSSALKSAALLDRLLKVGRYRVTGTMKEPHARFEISALDAVSQVLQHVSGELLKNLLSPFQQEE